MIVNLIILLGMIFIFSLFFGVAQALVALMRWKCERDRKKYSKILKLPVNYD